MSKRRSQKLIKRSSRRQIKPNKISNATHPIKSKTQLTTFVNCFKKAISEAKTPLKRAQARRNYLIVLFALNTGLRAEDYLQLRVRDVARGFVDIKENKTGKRQSFALNPQIEKLVNEYAAKAGLGQDDYLFTTQTHRSKEHKPEAESKPYFDPITRQNLNKIINRMAQEAGIDYKVGVHGLRKTFGYRFLEDKLGNAESLMQIYNHSSLAVTKRYTEWGLYEVNRDRAKVCIGLTPERRGRKKKPR